MSRSYWVIATDGQSYGPADEGTLGGWARQGRLTADTVLQDAQTNVRTTAGRVPSIASAFGPPAYQPPARQPAAPPQPPAYSQPVAYQQAAAYQQQHTAVPAHMAYTAPPQPPAVVYHQHVTYQQPPAGYVPPGYNAMAYHADAKNVGIAYLLWFFFGGLGVHRFYTGHTGSGTAQLLLMITSFPLMFVGIGFITFFAVCIWVFIDIFLIPGLVNQHNAMLAARCR